jgi:DNA-binding IclR family transcriptional regulator
VLDGGHVVIVAQVDSPEFTGFYVKMGSKVELMHAATGHVILAHQTEGSLRRALDEWARETKRKKPPDFDSHLKRIRSRGYERRASYQVKGVVNISFPVFSSQGNAVAGLTVPYVKRLEDKVSIPDVVAALRGASREISEALGADPVPPALRRTRLRR